MCSTAGAIDADAGRAAARVKMLNDSQGHRGPDHLVTVRACVFMLGNMRLAFQDPSQAGNQPFVSSDGRTQCVFNTTARHNHGWLARLLSVGLGDPGRGGVNKWRQVQPDEGAASPARRGLPAMVSWGFAQELVQDRLTLFSQFSGWLGAEGMAPAMSRAGTPSGSRPHGVPGGRSRGCHRRARRCGTCGTSGQVPPEAAAQAGDLLDAYRGYLAAERELAVTTIRSYLRVARLFLAGNPDRGSVSDLTAADVTVFVVAECGPGGPSAKKTVTALGSLLRYLHVAGLTAVALAAAVPRIARQRPGLAPQGIEDRQVARMLSACDRFAEGGRPDLAIVMLLARLGLRACEVAALMLDDFRWRRGEVEIHGIGNRHERPAAR